MNLNIFSALKRVKELEAQIKDSGSSPVLSNNSIVLKIKEECAKEIADIRADYTKKLEAIKMDHANDIAKYTSRINESETSSGKKAADLMSSLGVGIDELPTLSPNFPDQIKTASGVTLTKHNR